MKRTILGLCAALLLGGAAWAEEYEPSHLTVTAATNATLVTSCVSTSDAVYTGCLDYLYVDLGGFHSPTVTVTVATYSMNGWPSRTLFTKVLTADAGFPIRQLATSTAGTAGTDAFMSIPLFFDKLVLTAYMASVNHTNVMTVDAYTYVTP